MTPAARLQSAIEILDRILAGQPAEQALTNWGRSNRFAGSKDRAAIRDHVFDCIRCKRSYAHAGGGTTGRGLALGMLRDQGADPETLFTGARHAPAPLGPQDAAMPGEPDRGTRLDCPDWLLPELDRSLGPRADAVLDALRSRAPVFLRVNIARTTRDAAITALARDDVTAQPHPLADTALHVTEGARRIRNSAAFADGLVELQDAASQAIIAALPDMSGLQVLDYCAGGGGKALAMAARGATVTAHDAQPSRMRDLPARARRAGTTIAQMTRPQGSYDLVLADAPCSGSGAWRRAPHGKWALTAEGLQQLNRTQDQILRSAWDHVTPGGFMVYATCSLMACENQDRVQAFVSTRPDASLRSMQSLTPLDGGDGFFAAKLKKAP